MIRQNARPHTRWICRAIVIISIPRERGITEAILGALGLCHCEGSSGCPLCLVVMKILADKCTSVKQERKSRFGFDFLSRCPTSIESLTFVRSSNSLQTIQSAPPHSRSTLRNRSITSCLLPHKSLRERKNKLTDGVAHTLAPQARSQCFSGKSHHIDP